MTVIVYSPNTLVVPSASAPAGPPGPPGTGTTIGVQDEITLLGTAFSRLKFSGPGVKASDAGGGMAEINVPENYAVASLASDGTDQGPALQTVIDSLGTSGGTVLIPNAVRATIDTNVTVRANCHLVGPHTLVETPQDNAAANYAAVGGALILNSTATITLKGGATARGLLVHRKGMTFPAADASGYAGTAFTAGGDGTAVFSCLVLGFNLAYDCTNYQRPRAELLMFDCTNGINVTNCADVLYFSRCHGWPFATIAASGAATRHQRAGTAYRFQTRADWGKISNCFSYGYARGIYGTNVNSMTVENCGADNTNPSTAPNTGSIGCAFDGTSDKNRIIGFQTAAQDSGVTLNCASGTHNEVVNLNVWSCINNGLNVSGAGDVTHRGGTIQDVINAVTLTNASATLISEQVKFKGTITTKYNVTAGILISDVPMNFTPTVTTGGGSGATFTVNSCSYVRSRNYVDFRIDVSQTAAGTGTTSINVTTPVQSVEYAVLNGRDILSTGNALHGTIDPSTSLIKVRKYDNTYPGASGARFIVNGRYRWA